MSWQIELIRAAEFVRLGPEGRFDLAASKAALGALAAACHKRGVYNAVLDLRGMQPGPKPVFTTSDLVELVNTFPAAGFTKELRLAILYHSDPHKRARLFAFVGTLHGWDVCAFGDFEHALTWLTRPRSSPPRDETALGKSIRIRNARRNPPSQPPGSYHASLRSGRSKPGAMPNPR
ncbi:MAG TPA: hypothetical protein VL361_24390 [Candidatus Limnocylindrales bacterium]|jgi:hypothetical protein|nr:hypothetical protein [Candidatus Limnocylindrales bacterium]